MDIRNSFVFGTNTCSVFTLFFSLSTALSKTIMDFLIIPSSIIIKVFSFTSDFAPALSGISKNSYVLTSGATLVFATVSVSTSILYSIAVINRSALGSGFRKHQIDTQKTCIQQELFAITQKNVIKTFFTFLIGALVLNLIPIFALSIECLLSTKIIRLIKSVREIYIFEASQIGLIIAIIPLNISFNMSLLILSIIASRYVGARSARVRGVIIHLLPWIMILIYLIFQANSNASEVVKFILIFMPYLILTVFWCSHTITVLLKVIRRYEVERQKQKTSLLDGWLFLRSFALDSTWVYWPFDLLRFLPFVGKRRDRLEHVIAECVIRFGPLRAVGNPTDPDGDHGIPREYLSDDAWQPFIVESLKKTRGIVFLFGAGKHISWELERLMEINAVGRTVFITPPILQDVRHFLQKFEKAVRAIGLPQSIINLLESGQCICFYRATTGWHVILNKRRSAFDYQIAIHKALSDLSIK